VPAGSLGSSCHDGPVDSAARRIRGLAPGLSGLEQRLRYAAQVASAGRGGESLQAEQFLFVCADRLRDLAGRVAHQARLLPALPDPPADPERRANWLRQVERGAARTVTWVPVMEEISLSASLLALESSLALAGGGEDSRRLIQEIDGVADELSRTWAGFRSAAADLAWAARDAASWQGQHAVDKRFDEPED
jgi:hypothetical protein